MFKSYKGFTLIELIAVVALIGILAGIAIPRILDIRREATYKASVANAAVLQEAFERAKVQCKVDGTVWAAIEAAGNSAATVSGVLKNAGYMSATVSDVTGTGTFPDIAFAASVSKTSYTEAN